jgi:hypothetical protein
MQAQDGLYFEEVQKNRQWWLWAVVLAPCAVIGYGAVRQLVFGQPWGDRPLSDAGLGLLCVFLAAVLVWLYKMSLLTQVSAEALTVQFKWLWRPRLIPLSTVHSYRVVTYRPLADYGGWGIRYGFKGGKAYTSSGTRGVQLEFEDGERLLIGSQRPEELARAIEQAKTGEAQPRALGRWQDDGGLT